MSSFPHHRRYLVSLASRLWFQIIGILFSGLFRSSSSFGYVYISECCILGWVKDLSLSLLTEFGVRDIDMLKFAAHQRQCGFPAHDVLLVDDLQLVYFCWLAVAMETLSNLWWVAFRIAKEISLNLAVRHHPWLARKTRDTRAQN